MSSLGSSMTSQGWGQHCSLARAWHCDICVTPVALRNSGSHVQYLPLMIPALCFHIVANHSIGNNAVPTGSV